MSGRFVWFNFVVPHLCCQEVNTHTACLPRKARLIMHWQQVEEQGQDAVTRVSIQAEPATGCAHQAKPLSLSGPLLSSWIV